MKKLMTIVVILISIIIPIHLHDDECGYNPETKTGCKYQEIIYDPNIKWPPEG